MRQTKVLVGAFVLGGNNFGNKTHRKFQSVEAEDDCCYIILPALNELLAKVSFMMMMMSPQIANVDDVQAELEASKKETKKKFFHSSFIYLFLL